MTKKKVMPDGYVFGRPTDYKPEYCEMLIEHMASGKSFESFGAVVFAARATLYLWEKANQDFLDAKKIGVELSLDLWEQHGIDGLYTTVDENYDEKTGRLLSRKTKSLNTGVWFANMKNRHGWRDRVEKSFDEEKPFILQYKLDDDDKPDEKP